MQAPFRAIYFLRFFGRQGFVLGFGGWVVGIRSHCRVPRCEKAEVLRRARGFRRWVRIRQGDWGWRYRGSGAPPRPLPGDASLSARTWLDAPAHHCVADSRQTPRPMTGRTEEGTSELQSLMRISYAGFWLKKKKGNRINKE